MKKKITSILLSIIMVVSFIPQIAFAAEGEALSGGLITDFAEMETTDYYYEGNPEEEELTLNLPETLGVYLDNSTEVTQISVSWEAVEDFDDTDFYFYSMKPVWGSEYVLSDTLSSILDVPWITVYKQEPENNEVEPILTEEEIEPVYTEEEGPVEPDSASLEGFAESTLGAARDVFLDETYAADLSNTTAIYNYLTQTMGLNTAAACGVMTNLNAESAMSPTNLQNTYNSSFGLSDQEYTDRVNAGKGAYKTKAGKSKNYKTDSAGYGLCQWTSSGRKTNMLSSAISGKKSIGDINMQLAFLNSELQNSYSQVYTTLKGVPNTAAGAYIAAAEFCLSFEIPANTVATAASRGKTCLSGYWQTYSGSNANVKGTSFVSLCGYSFPNAVKKGSGMNVRGYAVSNYNIVSVTGKIVNSSGKDVYSKTMRPNTSAYKLSNIDEYMKFSKLSNGSYTYVISATDSFGGTASASHTFKVSSSGSTTKAYGFATSGTSTATPEAAVPATTPEGNSEVTAPTKTPTAKPATVIKKTYSGALPKLPNRGYFKKGDKGSQVKNLQVMLKWCGISITTGGEYGPATFKAVKKLQKKLGLKQDGLFGKKTLEKVKKLKR